MDMILTPLIRPRRVHMDTVQNGSLSMGEWGTILIERDGIDM